MNIQEMTRNREPGPLPLGSNFSKSSCVHRMLTSQNHCQLSAANNRCNALLLEDHKRQANIPHRPSLIFSTSHSLLTVVERLMLHGANSEVNEERDLCRTRESLDMCHSDLNLSGRISR